MAPLGDILVLDFTRAVAGPFCTMMLGDLGARVINVEEPAQGDETCAWGPPFVGDSAAYFLTMNRNKESVAVDLKSDDGLRLVRAIAAKADVVVENFRPGVMARLGLGYEALSWKNPRLVFASISGFGCDGPDRDRPGYDMIIQAMSGSMHTSAAPGEHAAKIAFPVSDIVASLFAGKAILAALYARERTGPRGPEKEEGMEKPKRARRRKPETSQGGPEAAACSSPEGRVSIVRWNRKGMRRSTGP